MECWLRLVSYTKFPSLHDTLVGHGRGKSVATVRSVGAFRCLFVPLGAFRSLSVHLGAF